MGQLRIGLTISGAASLGAYEGGALAALLVAVQRLLGEVRDGRPPVRVDAIAGASAGSITGLLTARTLLAGLDPLWVMHQAWVERASLQNLRTGDPHSPLSTEALERMAVELLDADLAHQVAVPQASPVHVHMALACLQGLSFRIARLKRKSEIDTTTYLDWAEFTFEGKADGDLDQYLRPVGASAVEVALASGANAIGFPPKLLNRRLRAEDCELIEAGGAQNVPADGWQWYTDGGTIENEPFGRTLGLANDVDAASSEDFQRLVVLVHPHPTHPRPDNRWVDETRRPGWIDTGRQAFAIARAQSIHDDLRRLEKANSRISWKTRLCEELGRTLTDDQAVALRRLLGDINADLRRVREQEGRPAKGDPPAGQDRADLVRVVLDRVAGLAGKQEVGVEVVSPRTLLGDDGATQVEQLLAGESVFHFGGFLEHAFRQSDFDLGYQSTERWLDQGGLTASGDEFGLDPALADVARQAVEEAYRPRPVVERPGRPRRLGLGAKVAAARLVAHMARVVSWETVFGRRDRPDSPPEGAPEVLCPPGGARAHGP